MGEVEGRELLSVREMWEIVTHLVNLANVEKYVGSCSVERG